jgi:hypothetical protein
MNITAYFQYQLSEFQKRLEDNGYECPSLNDLVVKKGYFRCMARVNDPNKLDINKRCKNNICRVDLCNVHLNKKDVERVTEYPDEKGLLSRYRKNIPEIDNTINLSHNAYYIEEIKTRLCREINENKILLKTNMDIIKELIDNKETLLTELNLDKTSTKIKISELLNNYIRIKFNNAKCTKKSISELTNILYELTKTRFNPNYKPRVKITIKNNTNDFKNNHIQTINNIVNNHIQNDYDIQNNSQEKLSPITNNLSNLSIDNIKLKDDKEIIYITDSDSNTAEFYLIEDDGRQLLYTEKGMIAGYVREWIDEDDNVPSMYKTNDNTVLVPFNNLPVLEYEILPSATLYTGLKSDIYREYQYDEDAEIFRINPNISKN